MKLSKEQKREILLNKLDAVLKETYHNATPNHPYVANELSDYYWNWFNDIAQFEIEYISDGLGSTEKEYKKQRKLGFTHNERYYWLVSQITNYGKLHTWGRGGRTLAPDDLIKMGGGSSFHVKGADYFEEYNKESIVDIIEIVSAFNRYVKTWNSKENLAYMWVYACEQRKRDIKLELKDYITKLKQLKNEIRELNNLPGEICNILKRELNSMVKQFKTELKLYITYTNEINGLKKYA